MLRTSFNPRVLAGGRDIMDKDCFEVDHWFQSTRTRGRTRRSGVPCPAEQAVSIHAYSREDATLTSSALYDRGKCFNPRVLAGGRDIPFIINTTFDTVSIHASSREDATCADNHDTYFARFQSTRPRGRTRHAGDGDCPRAGAVSIHASSREDATGGRKKQTALAAVSIHASSREDATPDKYLISACL